MVISQSGPPNYCATEIFVITSPNRFRKLSPKIKLTINKLRYYVTVDHGYFWSQLLEVVFSSPGDFRVFPRTHYLGRGRETI